MAVRKVKGSWQVDFRAEGRRNRIRSPENTRAGAQAYEAHLRQKLSRGEPIGNAVKELQQKQTFEQFAQDWFKKYVVPNNKQQEQRMKGYILGSSLNPFFGKMVVGQITTRHIEHYKAHELERRMSRKTVNNRLAVLGKCIRTAYEWLEIKGVPPKIALLRCPPPQTNYLTLEECALLLSSAEGIVRDMILVALHTGMRQGELRGLQWSSINWHNETITVRHSLNDRAKQLESPKSNRERHIPMDSHVYETLSKRKKGMGYVFLNEDGQPFDSQRLIRQLDKVRERAEMRKFGWHTLRHTFATLLATNGGALHAVQALLGHSTITMTMRYAHATPSTLRSTIDLLSSKSAQNADVGQPVVTR